MGPMFYLVQCEEELLLISAVLLADWPHEFQPWPCAGGAGDGDKHRGSGLPPSARVGGWGRRFWAGSEIRSPLLTNPQIGLLIDVISSSVASLTFSSISR